MFRYAFDITSWRTSRNAGRLAWWGAALLLALGVVAGCAGARSSAADSPPDRVHTHQDLYSQVARSLGPVLPPAKRVHIAIGQSLDRAADAPDAVIESFTASHAGITFSKLSRPHDAFTELAENDGVILLLYIDPTAPGARNATAASFLVQFFERERFLFGYEGLAHLRSGRWVVEPYTRWARIRS